MLLKVPTKQKLKYVDTLPDWAISTVERDGRMNVENFYMHGTSGGYFIMENVISLNVTDDVEYCI